MKLRPYQSTCIENIQESFADGAKRLIVAMATGTGKTRVAVALAALVAPLRVMFICHTKELIAQAAAAFKSAGLTVGIEQAENRVAIDAATLFGSTAPQVTVASIQTLARRKERFPADYFGLIVCDECHMSVSDSWLDVLGYFKSARVVGITATPSRSDMRELGSFYQQISFNYGLIEAINDGWLAPLKVQTVPISIPLHNVRMSGGDYDAAELDRVIRPYLKECAQAVKDHAPRRRTIAFLPLIDTSRLFVDECRKAGLRAEHVDGDSPDRQELQDKLRNGEIDLLSNSQLLSVGVDIPPADCVINLRPTRSFIFFAQAVGRITRALTGVLDGMDDATPETRRKAIAASQKPDALILDALWLYEKNRAQIVRPANLVAPADDIAVKIADLTDDTAKEGKPKDLVELSQRATDVVLKQREDSLRKTLEANKHRGARLVDAVEYALMVKNEALSDVQLTLEWHKESPSAKQLAMLGQWGFDPHSIQSKGHASKLIEAIFARKNGGLASPKQVKLLRQYKHAAPEKATFEEASAFIDKKLAHFKNIARFRKR